MSNPREQHQHGDGGPGSPLFISFPVWAKTPSTLTSRKLGFSCTTARQVFQARLSTPWRLPLVLLILQIASCCPVALGRCVDQLQPQTIAGLMLEVTLEFKTQRQVCCGSPPDAGQVSNLPMNISSDATHELHQRIYLRMAQGRLLGNPRAGGCSTKYSGNTSPCFLWSQIKRIDTSKYEF